MVKCEVCGKLLSQLQRHIKFHDMTVVEYRSKYPGAQIWSNDQKTKLKLQMTGGRAMEMAKLAAGCKKPKLSNLMKGNKRALGSDRSAEKERYSQQAKQQYADKNFGVWTDERRLELSKRTKKMWSDGVMKHHWHPKWENDLAVLLTSLEVPFIQQYRISGCNKPFDFFLPELNMLVELNGCFWHGCPKCYKPHPIQIRVQANDIEKRRAAEENGMSLVVIWEHEKFSLPKFMAALTDAGIME